MTDKFTIEEFKNKLYDVANTCSDPEQLQPFCDKVIGELTKPCVKTKPNVEVILSEILDELKKANYYLATIKSGTSL